MPYYTKSEDWLKQSSLLIEARPATTKVTTTYTVKPPRKEDSEDDEKTKPTTTTTTTPKKSYGHLILKTYDPASGTCLKYRTSKAAEVSRLIQMLGTLGKKMAGVPEEDIKDEVMADAPPAAAAVAVEAAAGSGASTPAPGASASAPAPGGGGGGGKGKKKKGKR
ncbi:signal recognition particle 9 kDa protein-domain-containing protein [Rhypophila decipiens]|uniref:Signal recognition particle 9 kDa protein-domain-containing protein n=1 Tax=Rhypophila decipiens TaxID=261697 RepID=A0AAN6YJK9_9PEZI|nr:signal recognition particle 9 kDa protein-domain-containing protein [Rhypophila decipiens]